MESDRRKEQRQRLVLKVTLGHASDFVVRYTGDVSARGAFIVTDSPLPVGGRVHVEVSFPGLLSPHRIAGVVRWSKGLDVAAVDEQPGFGVEWTEQPHDELLRALGDSDVVAAAPRRFCVLVVDDDADVRSMLQAALSKVTGAALDVEEASDGAQALARVARGGVDLVLLELNMPEMDGHTVLDRIRSDERSATLPVVVVSAGGTDSRKRSEDGGCDFFLGKPLRIVDLLDTVARLLRVTAAPEADR